MRPPQHSASSSFDDVRRAKHRPQALPLPEGVVGDTVPLVGGGAAAGRNGVRGGTPQRPDAPLQQQQQPVVPQHSASYSGAAQVLDGSGGRPKIPMLRYMLGTILVTAPLGALNSWDRLEPILVAFLKSDDHNSLDNPLEVVPVVLYISAAFSMMGFGWILGRRDGVRSRSGLLLCVVLGAVLGMTGLVLTSICTTMAGVVICYGVLFGAAMGTYLVPLYYASQCFPHTVGVTVGFANCCLGAGQLGMYFLLGELLGIGKLPRNIGDAIPMEVYKRVPNMFRIHALVHLFSMGLGVVILPDPRTLMLDSAPRDAAAGAAGGGAEEAAASGAPSAVSAASPPQSTTYVAMRRVLGTWYFWLLPLMSFATSLSGALVVGNYAHIGVNFNSVDQRDVSDIADWAVVAGILGRFLWGMAADATGYHASLLASGALTASFVLSYGFIRNSGVFHAWTCFITFFYVGNLAILPTAVHELFGCRVFAWLFPIVFTGCLLGNISALFLSHPFTDVRQTVGHIYLTVLAFVLGTVNLIYFPVRRCNQLFTKHGNDTTGGDTTASFKPGPAHAPAHNRTITIDSGSISQRGSEGGSGNWYGDFRSPATSSAGPIPSPSKSDERPSRRTTQRIFSTLPTPYDELR